MFTAIIVDDELHCRQMLAGMLDRFFPGRVNVLALCSSVDDAMISLKQHRPQVVFLDIEMPHHSGFDLIEKSDDYPFQVVFTTAHNKYAVKAFKVNAIEYLLKPIQHDDLQLTLEKLDKRLSDPPKTWKEPVLKTLTPLIEQVIPKIGLPTMSGHLFINVHEIIRCEADSNYTIVHLPEKRVVVSRTLKQIEEALKKYSFFRVHKSHLINLEKVLKYSKADGGTIVLSDQVEVPVSRNVKEELERVLPML